MVHKTNQASKNFSISLSSSTNTPICEKREKKLVPNWSFLEMINWEPTLQQSTNRVQTLWNTLKKGEKREKKLVPNWRSSTNTPIWRRKKEEQMLNKKIFKVGFQLIRVLPPQLSTERGQLDRSHQTQSTCGQLLLPPRMNIFLAIMLLVWNFCRPSSLCRFGLKCRILREIKQFFPFTHRLL